MSFALYEQSNHIRSHKGSSAGNVPIVILSVLTTLLLISNALLAFIVLENNKLPSTYAECIASGGTVVSDIYPKSCVTNKGVVFAKPITKTDLSFLDSQPTPIPTRSRPTEKDGCVVGGCSNELCLDKSKGETPTNCVYKSIYACYRHATCERQDDGDCGWTKDSVLTACLDSYRDKD